jgi:hypothetical protein
MQRFSGIVGIGLLFTPNTGVESQNFVKSRKLKNIKKHIFAAIFEQS